MAGSDDYPYDLEEYVPKPRTFGSKPFAIFEVDTDDDEDISVNFIHNGIAAVNLIQILVSGILSTAEDLDDEEYEAVTDWLAKTWEF